jgi:diguanylate cyclase (GGDEF)-like protein/PAS domain S-box-containing protein
MFGSRDGHYDHFYLCFIPIIWIAMRQGVRRVVTGLLALNFGIVVAMHLFPPTAALFAKVALLMLVLSAVGLIVGSEVSERHRLAIDLNEQTTYLDSLVQNSPLGIAVLDREGRVELANSAFEKLFQYDRHELASIDIESMRVPDDEATDSAQLIPQIFAGNAMHRTVRQRRKDGTALDLALHGVPLLLNNNEVRGAYLIYEDISEQLRANEAQQRHAESLNQLVNELELRTRQMTTLNEMGALLQCSGTVQEACVVVADSVQKLFPEAPSGALYLFRSSRDLIEAAVRWGKNDVLAPTFPPDACWSLRRGQPHWSESLSGGVACQHLSKSSTAECLCVPMVAQGNTIGILHLEFEGATRQSGTGNTSFRQSHQQLAISVSSHIALSLASLQLRETLREQSILDPLTRLFNRRFLEESLERELQIASRKKQAVAVLFLDLDHFKRFNDTFGHDAGDMVLQSLADLFRTFFRATDICCRYGGEEFAIILPESSAQDAAVRANGLRSEVKSLRLQYKRQTLGPLSLSAGVAAFPEHASASNELLEIADQCLYESKAGGRDVVTVAPPNTRDRVVDS